MDVSWDADNFEPKLPTTLTSNKWEGEDEDEAVKDSWEDEEEEKRDEEKKEAVAPQPKPKKKIFDKIAEKERLEREKLMKSAAEIEDLTPEQKAAEKLRQQKLQEESDLLLALETFGVTEGAGKLDSFHPTNKQEFNEFAELLCKKINIYKAKEEFPAFVDEMVKNIIVQMASADIKRIKMTVDNLYIEKQKAEKNEKSKKPTKGKGKAKLKVEGESVTAFAVLNITCAKNSTAKTKPKRQLENIRTPQNLQYSLVLPHSRVAHFRSLPNNRRISNVSPRTGKLPPYAVQMEPVVQYSQKDPLYPTHDHLKNAAVNKNEIFAQPKILNVHDQESEGSFGSPYGVLPTAPLYSEDYQPQYYDGPEPIIEIIIKESNETLPAPPPPPIQKKKKEPVQVFYVKYSKDPHSKDKVIYEQPIPAITPPSNDEDDHHHDYVTVTPEPLYVPTQTTTLRAIIKPESEIYHSNSNVKITFGNEHHHHGNRRGENLQGEDHEETAPRPAIALPNPQQNGISLERSASPRPQYVHEAKQINQPGQQIHLSGRHAESRIQFQQPYINHEPQLPRQGPSAVPFRSQTPRQNPFGPSPSLSPRPSFASASPSPSNNFINVAPTVPGPIIPFGRPSNPPQFGGRPHNLPAFGTRPHSNGPPRASFHSGPQRPFHQQQHQTYFDEAKYLQENYHTITTDQIDSQKSQPLPNRQNFNSIPKPTSNPPLVYFPDQVNRPQQLIPYNQQLPQQRPPQVFDLNKNKASFAITPSRSPFFNLKPSPPYIEDNRIPFQRQPSPQLSQQHINYHQTSQSQSRPSVQIGHQENSHTQNSFSSVISPSPSPALIPQNQFLPQPSPTPIFDFAQQPPLNPNQFHNHNQQSIVSERPNQFNNFQPTPNFEHQQNIKQFAPKGSELVAAIPKYEQHFTVNDANVQSNFNGLINSNQPTPTVSQADSQKKHQEQQAQSQYNAEQEQVRAQLAHNVRKQQEEIQRLQSQLQLAQQQHQQQYQQHHSQQQQQQQQHQQHQQQHQQQQIQQQQQLQYQQQQIQQNYNQYNQQQFQQSTGNPQYIEERSRLQPNYVTSSSSPLYYQSTSRTVEIKPTTQKHVSSTENSVSSTPAPQKNENKKRPAIELPDEVPDDLRQQLLSSGILDNADISVLDYDKVGETPLESLPPDQLANFFGAGGGQQIASSEHRPIVVTPNGERIESRMDESIDDDQEIAASENVPSFVAPPQKQAVEMKVVHFDPKTPEGQKIASDLVKEDATQVDPVALNDKKYNRYLPLKVSGNKFPLPDVLKGRKITSVVVLAPVETETLGNEHLRSERSAAENLRGIKFVAGESLQNLLKKPTEDNFKKWLETENKTATDQQSVILLVTGKEEPTEGREIFMYDITSGNVNKLSGDLSNAFVEAAENNSLSKDIENLAIEGEGTPESFNQENGDEALAEGSENVPLFVDLSGTNFNDKNSNKVLISSGYSKTKKGRAIKRH